VTREAPTPPAAVWGHSAIDDDPYADIQSAHEVLWDSTRRAIAQAEATDPCLCGCSYADHTVQWSGGQRQVTVLDAGCHRCGVCALYQPARVKP
jgi:hypothetical protein